jgi:hypothetical protein
MVFINGENMFKKKSPSKGRIEIAKTVLATVEQMIEKGSTPPEILAPYHHDGEQHHFDATAEFIKHNSLEMYINEEEKQYCTENDICFGTIMWENILKQIKKGMEFFIKNKGNVPTDIFEKANVLVSWRLFKIFVFDLK